MEEPQIAQPQPLVQPPVQPPVTPTPSRRFSRRKLILALAILILAVGGTGTALAWKTAYLDAYLPTSVKEFLGKGAGQPSSIPGEPASKKPSGSPFGELLKRLFGPPDESSPPKEEPAEPPEYYDVPVFVISYFPVKDGNLDPDITGMNDDLASIRRKVGELTDAGIKSLTRASIYHGYKDSAAAPFLRYSLLESKEFLTAIPVSSNEIPWNPGVYRPDYKKILTDLNICDYVENKGVKQVWLWGYHYGNLEPVESNMAMGTLSRAYWNLGTYGDVSNSERINDLPVCKTTYTLYNYNYGRGLGELLEDHTHQLEATFSFVDSGLWNKLVLPYGEAPGVNHCGWTHSPPNTKKDYDWTNETDVLSDCEDWKPDGSGEARVVDCHTWYGNACLDNGGVEFKVWWMQNIPGKGNNLMEGGRRLRNWWEFYGDFDQALQVGKGLIY